MFNLDYNIIPMDHPDTSSLHMPHTYHLKYPFLLENDCHTFPFEFRDDAKKSISKISLSGKELEVVSKTSSIGELF